MPRVLHILDSVAAARDLLARSANVGDLELLSTHYSVVSYLGERGIACRDCTDFLSVDAAGAALREASSELDERLARLDYTLGARMCEAAGLPRLAMFHASFKYLAQYNLAGRWCLERVIKERLAESAAVVFHHALDTSTDPVFSFVDAARRVCEERGVPFSDVPVPSAGSARQAGLARRLPLMLGRALQSPGWAAKRAREQIIRWMRRSPGIEGDAPVVLLFEPHGESFFESALADSGVHMIHIGRDGVIAGTERFRSAACTGAARMAAVLEEWLRAQPVVAENDLERRWVAVVGSNLPWLEALCLAHHALQSRNISAAAWDRPLTTRPPLNLIVELFLSSDIPVLGRQHGANYGDQKLGAIHFDADFNRCTHYFSYGFGPREFAMAYPGARHRCAFIPAGHPPPVVSNQRRPVDIAFPIMNSVPLFYLARIPESELVRRQKGILRAMEARRDLQCVVKPPPGFGPDTFAHTEALTALRHVRLEHGTWTHYLARWQPRLVVFESASTPLLEVLPLDVDIFLMLDPLFPFTEAALSMLRQRAHVFETLEELLDAIRRYGLEPVARLRDTAYYDTYANRGSAAAVAQALLRTRIPAALQGTP